MLGYYIAFGVQLNVTDNKYLEDDALLSWLGLSIGGITPILSRSIITLTNMDAMPYYRG